MISEETRKKMRLAKLGKIGNTIGKHWKIKDTSKMHHKSWNKGIPMNEESKQKMILSKIGKSSKRKGIKLTDEHINKLIISHKGQVAWNKGKKVPQMSGEYHWNWQGGKTNETKKRINTIEWKLLRKKIYLRDNWTCQKCYKHCSDDIQCHHLFPGNNDENKLITLCKSCHLKIHHEIRKKLKTA